jgi:Threonine aldolase
MNPDLSKDLPFIRKRAAQLLSKSRFIAAQFDAYLHDNLWLNMANHSNNMAMQLQKVSIILSMHELHGRLKPMKYSVFWIKPTLKTSEERCRILQLEFTTFETWIIRP